MDILEIMSITAADIVWSAIAIVVTVVFLSVVRVVRDKIVKKMEDHAQKNVIKKVNIINIIFRSIKYFTIVICVLTVLQINGVNVTSVLTGIGIASVLAGIAVQDLFKDLIQGMRIITDDFFSVGDYIEYGGELCRVVGLSGRTTTLMEVETQDVINICNRNIVEVRRLSGRAFIKVPLTFSADTSLTDKIFKKSEEDILNIVGIDSCEFIGLDAYENDKAIYMMEFHCNPGEMLDMKRKVQRIILDNIYSGGLKMAVNQIDIINS